MATTPHSKILTHDQLLTLRASARERGGTLVQCHGCFDIVHPGHIRHLRFARQQGDLLLVSITADDGINKGQGRPLFTADLRAENLAALDCVDWVYVNQAPTAETLLEEVQPDVYIKGREYEGNDDPRFASERKAVERHGGRVVFSSGDIVFSSSALVRSLEADPQGTGDRHADPRLASLRQFAENHDLSTATLTRIVNAMQGKNTVVIGETIIDNYISCDRPSVASDAPCLALRPLDHTRFNGGAAVIARHAAAMGAAPTLITALPEHDAVATNLIHELESEGITVRSIRASAPVPEKQRFIVGTEKVMKLDLARDLALDAEARDQLIATANDAVLGSNPADATILADFGLGMLTRRTIADLCSHFRDRTGVLTGDVSGQRNTLLTIKHADLLTPSESELRAAVGDFESSLNAVVWRLMEANSATGVCVTMGDDGATLFQRRAVAFQGNDGWHSWLTADHTPTLATHRVDPLGCGDALLAIASLALAAGATRPQAIFLGSVAAAIHAERLGNHAVNAREVIARIERINQAHLVVRPHPGLLTAS